MIKEQQTNLINILGVGAFGFLATFEFSSFIEYLTEQLLFINLPGSVSILWVPELVGLIIFSVITVWAINKFNKSTALSTKKTLTSLIIAFFGIMLIRYVYSMTGTGLLLENFPEEFTAFHELRSENHPLQRLDTINPILKYLIFGVTVLVKRKSY